MSEYGPVTKDAPMWPRTSHHGNDLVDASHRATPLSSDNVAEALAEKSSRRVLAACVEAPRSVKDLSESLLIPLASVYRHVHRLMDLGVLVVERSAMTPEGKKYDLYRSRIVEAHLDLAGGEERVRWVANDQVESRLIGLWDAFRVARGRP